MLENNGFLQIFNNIQSPHIVIDEKHNIVISNTSAQAIFKEKLNEKKLENIFDISYFIEDINYVFEFGVKKSKDTLINNELYNVTITPLFSELDSLNVKYLDLQFEQLTKAKKNKYIEPSCEVVLDSLGVGIMIHDYEKIIYVNKTLEKMFEFTLEDFAGHSLGELMFPEESIAFVKECAKQGLERYETRAINKKGKKFQVEVVAKNIEYNGIKARSVIVTDIENIRNNEKELERTKEKYDVLLNAHYAAISLSQTGTGLFVEINNYAFDLLGYTRDELIGNTSVAAKIWYNENDRKTVQRLLLERGSVKDFECKLRKKDGSAVWVNYSAKPVVLYGETYIYSVARDITEKKENEKKVKEFQSNLVQAAKQNALLTLSSGLRHEINNPLTIAIGFSEVASERVRTVYSQDSDLSTDLNNIGLALQRIVDVIKNLEDFIGVVSYDSEVVDVAELVIKIAKLYQSIMSKEKINIGLKSSLTRSLVKVDISKLQQVLVNILLNAVDAIKIQKPKNGIIVFELKNEDNNIVIQISDNGVGIDEGDLENVFNPFYTTKDPGHGLGLGLAICKTFIDRMNGKMSITSVKAAGSVVTISLPVAL